MALEASDLEAIKSIVKSIVDESISAALKPIELRLDKIEMRLDRMELRLDRIELRLERVEEKIGRVERWLPLDNTYADRKQQSVA